MSEEANEAVQRELNDISIAIEVENSNIEKAKETLKELNIQKKRAEFYLDIRPEPKAEKKPKRKKKKDEEAAEF